MSLISELSGSRSSGEVPSRREFLKAAALAGVALGGGVGLPAVAAEPVVRSSGPKLKLSLAAYSFRSLLPVNGTPDEMAAAKMTLDSFLDYCAEQGLDGAELTGYYFPKVVQETPLRRVPEGAPAADAARQANIDAANDYLVGLKNKAFRLGLDVSGTAIGNDFCVPEGPAWLAQINLCKDWIDRAAAVSAPVIRIFAGKVPAGDNEAAAMQRCVAAINECLSYAARRGVFLAVENHGGITANPESMLKIVKAVKPSPWFGVNLDGGNFKTDDPYRDIALIAPYTLNAQVKVSVAPNGMKEPADLARVIDILRKADYRGYVVLEYEEAEDPMTEIPKHLAHLRELIA